MRKRCVSCLIRGTLPMSAHCLCPETGASCTTEYFTLGGGTISQHSSRWCVSCEWTTYYFRLDQFWFGWCASGVTGCFTLGREAPTNSSQWSDCFSCTTAEYAEIGYLVRIRLSQIHPPALQDLACQSESCSVGPAESPQWTCASSLGPPRWQKWCVAATHSCCGQEGFPEAHPCWYDRRARRHQVQSRS